MKNSPRLVLPLMVIVLSFAAALLTAAQLSPDDLPAAQARDGQPTARR